MTRNKSYDIIKTKQNDTIQNQIKRRGKNMDEKIYYSAEDIAKMLGVSMGKAYKILREINKDLASKGFLTNCGKKFRWSILRKNGTEEQRR